MLSVCIPVFNTAVKTLVDALVQQLSTAGIEWEIVVTDDGSTEEDVKTANSFLHNISSVRYFLWEINKGRSAARNFLAEKSQHAWLLFVDADSELINDEFIKKYLSAISNENTVLVGGRVCGPKPVQCSKQLHWNYCTQRENANSRIGFASNNFCISRKLMVQVPFHTDLKGWGHEDTDVGLQLKKQGVVVRYIQNPVLHQHLEDAEVFIQKSEQAISNLLLLEQRWSSEALAKEVKLYKWFLKVRQWQFTSIMLFFWRNNKKGIIRQLYSCKPSLKLFDFYRLGYLLSVVKGK